PAGGVLTAGATAGSAGGGNGSGSRRGTEPAELTGPGPDAVFGAGPPQPAKTTARAAPVSTSGR
ncbi:MAG: hypothetical protein M3Z25_14670, partial [Actinomycetota bacterium]|nr:hypothetical protein [Actinomycetota bacterium]